MLFTEVLRNCYGTGECVTDCYGKMGGKHLFPTPHVPPLQIRVVNGLLAAATAREKRVIRPLVLEHGFQAALH